MVSVAQLVEPRIVIPVVAGSSPVVHPTKSDDTYYMNTLAWKPNDIDLQLIDLALAEDLGLPFNDITTSTLFPDSAEISHAHIISKHPENIIICGLDVIKAVLLKLDSRGQIQTEYSDGQILEPGKTLLTISGPAKSLLMAERVILNFLQRLCAIASLTSKFAEKIKHTHARILDTRKTTPGFRHLEKYAVQCGGGVNHRMGLYDAIMIKDTHVDSLGGMKNALHKLPDDITQNFSVIVEVRSVDELKIVLKFGKNKVTRVLLDNMTPKIISECVELCKNTMPTEASGNINLDNVLEVAQSGVDFISIGKITHSVTSVDLSMKTIKD
jgi:nicotinate-nucleotide pyrophosphorylase (carboxylating)